MSRMTPKRIIYSDHAAGRLRGREITRQNVRRVVATGTRSKTLTMAGAQRWESRGVIGKREMSVIYIEGATELLVVTAQWIE